MIHVYAVKTHPEAKCRSAQESVPKSCLVPASKAAIIKATQKTKSLLNKRLQAERHFSKTMALVTQHYHLESHPADLHTNLPINGWYLLRVPIREERRAMAQLLRLGKCDYLTIWTTTTRHYDRSRKRQNVHSFLPGYIFLRTEDHSREDLFATLRPVIELTCLRDNPQFSCELNEFCKLVLAAGNDMMLRPGFAAGTLVEVTEGPLSGCRGRVLKHRGAWELVVGLSILGTTVASRIDITCVKEL